MEKCIVLFQPPWPRMPPSGSHSLTVWEVAAITSAGKRTTMSPHTPPKTTMSPSRRPIFWGAALGGVNRRTPAITGEPGQIDGKALSAPMKSTRRPQWVLGGWLAAIVATSWGCATLNPARLDDTLAAFHDDLRWGRPEMAARAVAQPAREDFSARHAQWSSRLRMADVEVEPPRSRDGRTWVRARYVWNFIDEVDQRETLLETRWSPGVNDWIWQEERLVSGDPRPVQAPAASSPSRPAATAADAGVAR